MRNVLADDTWPLCFPSLCAAFCSCQLNVSLNTVFTGHLALLSSRQRAASLFWRTINSVCIPIQNNIIESAQIQIQYLLCQCTSSPYILFSFALICSSPFLICSSPHLWDFKHFLGMFLYFCHLFLNKTLLFPTVDMWNITTDIAVIVYVCK